MRALPRLVCTLLLATAATPALAQQAQVVSERTDHVLWCASAFYWLAGSAADSGDDEESEMYDRWSIRLVEVGTAALTAEGFQPESIEELYAGYVDAALVQLADDTAPYDVATCAELLGDSR